MPTLTCRDLTAGYGGLVAIQQVSLSVDSGSIVGIVGPNGAGKSTLLRAITGVVALRGGTIEWDGESLDRKTTDARARAGLSMVQEGRRLFPSLSVEDNLMLGGYHASRAERHGRREKVLKLFPPLGDLLPRTAGVLSGGEQQMVAIGRALMGAPRCLLIDEPSLGLAPIVVEQIYRSLPTLVEDGMCVVLVEQEVQRVLSIADRVVVLHEGVVMHEGPAVWLREHPEDLSAMYLGNVSPEERSVG